jgi:uncharacterized protein YaiL (DUF2058 family)
MFGDELFKAGLLSKKDLRKAKQQAKKQKKQNQGNRKKKKHIQTEQKAKHQHEKQTEYAEKVQERKSRENIQNRKEVQLQLQNLLRQNQIAINKDNLFFWHPSANRKFVHKLYVSERIAVDLRAGKLGIAVLGSLSADDPIYIVVSRNTVKKVLELEPDRIVFWNELPPEDTPHMQLFHTYFR